ncbi:MAG TPA: hypothetical protein H9898_00445 [Candidatus Anaerobiospirillum stercoravium]|nr:hypothetical protein [Candidatus Anaerobiospirillum stercoravium]
MSKTEHPVAPLGLPGLNAQRNKRNDGSIRYAIRYRSEKTGKFVTIGHIEGGQEVGPIVFKEDFIARFPQLKKVTVLRKDDRSYVYCDNDHAPGKGKAKTKTCATKAKASTAKGKAKTTKTKAAAQTKATAQSKTKTQTKAEAQNTLASELIDRIMEQDPQMGTLLQEMVGQHLLQEMHKASGLGELDLKLGQGLAALGLDACAADDTFTSLADSVTSPSQMRAMFQQMNPKAERDAYFKDVLLNKAQLPAHGIALYCFNTADFSPFKPTFPNAKTKGKEMPEGEIPAHLIYLIDYHDNTVLYFGPSQYGIDQMPDFLGQAQQTYDHLLKMQGKKPQSKKTKQTKSATAERPIICHGGILSDASLLLSSCQTGFEVLGRLNNHSEYAQRAIAYALSQGMHLGKGAEQYDELAGIYHLALPEQLCPKIATPQGEKTLYLHVQVMPDFFNYSEVNALKAAGIMVASGKLTKARSEELRAQGFKHWCYILASTAPIDGRSMLDAYWEHGALQDELEELYHSPLLEICRGHERATFMGSLLMMVQATCNADNDPMLLRLAQQLAERSRYLR